MIAPGANGIDDGVGLELGLDEAGERVAALVAALVRSSASSWMPGTREFYWRMQMNRTLILAGIAACVITTSVVAQGGRQPSPEGSSATQVGGKYVSGGESQVYQGGKWIEIVYGRPLKRGRDLWGSGADYGKKLYDGAPVWRAGANVSTRLKSEVPLVIGGKTVPAGEYSLFIDLKPNNWTFIVSRWAANPTFPSTKDALFGAYDYTPDKDVLRTPMKLETLPYSVEQLAWSFADMSGTGGRLVLTWDKVMASVPFTVGK
jgi:hypothetical protein